MNKHLLLAATLLTAFGLRSHAATISFTTPTDTKGAFDVVVQATGVFDGRDTSTDGIISYGFNVGFSTPAVLTFDGATSGPLFDPAVSEPGTDVFGAASGFGVIPPISEPLILATLHFTRVSMVGVDIIISSDPLNSFQNLQYFDEPNTQPIAGTISIAAVPEPAAFTMCSLGLLALGFRRRKHA